jgi:hypothetical protein
MDNALTAASTRTRGPDVVLGVVWFALLAPPVAAALLAVLVRASGQFGGNPFHVDSVLGWWMLAVPTCYVGGMGPAIIAGALAGSRRQARPLWRALWPAVLAAATGTALVALFTLDATAMAYGAGLGAAACVVVGAPFAWFGRASAHAAPSS